MFPKSYSLALFIARNAHKSIAIVQNRSMKNWPEPPPHATVILPPKIEDRLLPPVPATPHVFPQDVVTPMKYPKADIEMRGPERIHNQLIYRQYGIIALGGGALEHAHFQVIRDNINKYMNTERFFAIWRVDPPWKAVSVKSQGKKLGGGKSKVHHYETPIKAGRIIIEVAGIGEFGEVERTLSMIVNKLPIYSMTITQTMMDKIKQEKLLRDANNFNPFEYRDLLRRNFSDSQRMISPREMIWGGTYF